MKKISVIINARLGSSRLKNKMTRSFCETDLLDIALKKINDLDFFEHRFLAAAESSLMERVKKYNNIDLLQRDKSSVEPGPHQPMVTFKHYLDVPTEYFFVINACAVFLSRDTIKRAYDVFQETEHNSYISVVSNRDWVFDSKGFPLTHTDPKALQNTSDGDTYLRATHAFYIANKGYFLKNNGKLWGLEINDPHLIKMPENESFDIDTDLDFKVSELLYKSMYS